MKGTTVKYVISHTQKDWPTQIPNNIKLLSKLYLIRVYCRLNSRLKAFPFQKLSVPHDQPQVIPKYCTLSTIKQPCNALDAY